ncbi:alpha/beta hydrolase family protein [Pontibacter ummariensis]|uniref:Alpha/beta hydrolase family protein n=1 Tax=Pontibacter ummariensis TaxID=1610492 RepID=A0A239BGH6_9BACT|nr:alpha/beta hydrolase [Pontibacter ummariensis]PRY16516.1 alpha/beta hydrolase family protein [Pontibacter ummariensis]SNS06551.1 Alpha/beta hydrolase family protein [Pontibacter ummariensis]
MSTIYFISGLGADWRMFQFLKLPRYLAQQHVHWIAPTDVNEPLSSFVQRLRVQIQDPAPILIGLSFGGIVAIELAKVLKPRKLILISSLATRHALPWYYRMAGKLKLQKRVPFRLMQSGYPLAPPFFGAHTRPEKKLLKRVILDMDELFLRWALTQLLNWQQAKVVPGLVQLHGTADLVLPLYDRPDIIKIKGGEHLMVMNRAEEVSAILSRILLDCTYDEQA